MGNSVVHATQLLIPRQLPLFYSDFSRCFLLLLTVHPISHKTHFHTHTHSHSFRNSLTNVPSSTVCRQFAHFFMYVCVLVCTGRTVKSHVSSCVICNMSIVWHSQSFAFTLPRDMLNYNFTSSLVCDNNSNHTNSNSNYNSGSNNNSSNKQLSHRLWHRQQYMYVQGNISRL